MVKVLIADDNVPFCESLFSALTKEKDFKIVGISYSGKNIEKKYFETQPDIMVLDLNLPQKNGIQIINDITEQEGKDPKKNIIVVSGEMKYRASLTNMKKVLWVLSKPVDFDKLITVIRETSRQKIMSEKINDITDGLLKNLHIPICKGRVLLKRSILTAYTRPYLLRKIEDLMKIVAKQEGYNNARSVRSTIDKIIERTFEQSNDNSIFYILDEYYGEKLTTKTFISSCVSNIRKIMKNN